MGFHVYKGFRNEVKVKNLNFPQNYLRGGVGEVPSANGGGGEAKEKGFWEK